MRFAVERQLEIIGEATNHLSENTKQSVDGIKWRTIKAFQNISVHEYFGLDVAIIWNIVCNDIPELETALASLSLNKN